MTTKISFFWREHLWHIVASAFSVLLFAGLAAAQTLTTLYSFGGYASDGILPQAGVIRDSKGNLYGTTSNGGTTNGYGTVFKVTAAGVEKILYRFTGGTDGRGPNAPLVRDAAGNLYGTDDNTVFKLDPSGKFSVLHTFVGTPDGNSPDGLIRDAAGNLYGATTIGGTYNAGTVYKLSPSGVETILYSFTGAAGDEGYPNGTLARDSAGNLYGTTAEGPSPGFYGTVFKVDPSGNETTLYTFSGGADGGLPGPVIRDKSGNLYGATAIGGNGSGGSGCGVVFKLDTSNTETVLYTFTGGFPSCNPTGALTRDNSGNLYGVTSQGGFGFGTVFELDASNNATTLYSFSGGNSGDGPDANGGLVVDSAGNLYGTTGEGGKYSLGSVFKLKP